MIYLIYMNVRILQIKLKNIFFYLINLLPYSNSPPHSSIYSEPLHILAIINSKKH